jgi:protein involved in polysaccharide export with SLBB domain
MPAKRPALKSNRSIDIRIASVLIMKLLRNDLCRYVSALCPLLLAIILTACGSPPPPNVQTNKPSPEEVERMLRSYPLRIGDKVSVEFSGIAEKMDTSPQDVKEDGSINLPYIGSMAAEGKTSSQLEKDIKAAYEPKYFPHINITVTPTVRFFYVMGMVNASGNGGRYPYVGPITVLDAIATAGDFNPFADKRHVQITRVSGKIEIVNCIKALKHPELNLPVYPGDRVTVPKRIL